jgi:hypothetical protein
MAALREPHQLAKGVCDVNNLSLFGLIAFAIGISIIRHCRA